MLPEETNEKFEKVLICIISENNKIIEKLQKELCEWNFMQVTDPKNIRSDQEAADWLVYILKQTESIAVTINHFICRCLHLGEVAYIANSTNGHSLKVIPAIFSEDLTSEEFIQLKKDQEKENFWKIISKARKYSQ